MPHVSKNIAKHLTTLALTVSFKLLARDKNYSFNNSQRSLISPKFPGFQTTLLRMQVVIITNIDQTLNLQVFKKKQNICTTFIQTCSIFAASYSPAGKTT